MRNYLYVLIFFVSLLDLAKSQYIWLYSYPPNTQNCEVTPTLVTSFANNQCYNDNMSGSFKYIISGTSNYYSIYYAKPGCTGENTGGNQLLASNQCIAGIMKSVVQSTYIIPSVNYIYYERWSAAGACSTTNPIRSVLKPGVCSYSDSQSGFQKGTLTTLSSATIAYSYEWPNVCTNLVSYSFAIDKCSSNIQLIRGAFSAISLSITFTAIKTNPTSLTFTVNINWPIPVTVNVQYLKSGAYAATSCNNLLNGQSCTISGIPEGISTKLRGVLSSGSQPFGGQNSGESGAIQLPLADSMKSLTVSARTTKTITVAYSSNKGISGQTTFVVKSTGGTVGSCSFTTCTISGLNPNTAYTITVNAVTNGLSTNAISVSGTTYISVSVPSLTVTNTPKTITATFSATGGVPSPATTYQVLLNGAVQSCTTSPCTISNLVTLSTYTVQVKAINDGTTTASSVQSIKLWDIMTTPTLSSTMYTTRAALTFSAAGGNPSLTRYSITVNGSPFAGCQSITATTCNVTPLAAGQSHTFIVTATNAGTTLSRTLSSSTYQEIQTPTLTTTTITTKTMILSFSAAQGIPSGTTYTISNNGVNVVGCIGISTTTCTLNGLTDATSYNIQVTATNDGKSLSTTKSFTTVTQVTVPVVSITQSKLSLLINYSTQFGYQTSTYNVIVNNVVVCSATTALQCTFNNVVLGTKYDVKVEVSNDGALKTGTSSFQTVSDTMKSLQIVSYTTSSVTFSYSSNYGVQGVTTYSFTINGSPVSCSGFSSCTVSGFTPSNPGLQLSIIGKSINYGNESPSLTVSQQLYPVVGTPSLTITNTPVSITATFSATGGVPSPATTYQVLLNGAVQSCTTSPCTINSLTTFSTYNVQVKAINDGTTTASSVQSIKLWDIMTTPTLSSTMYTTRAALTFSAAGGNPSLTRYSITVNGNPFAGCQSITATTCNVTPLAAGQSHTFIVTATNAGTTLSRTLSSSTYQEIQTPTLTTTTITTKTMILSFSAAQGIPSGTTYTISNNGVNVVGCIGISTTTCTLNGLTDATSYNIQVTATNDGKSLSTTKSFTTVTQVTVPVVSITQSKLSLLINYSTQFGYQTSTYNVIVNNAIICSATTVLQCTFNNVVLGTKYDVKVEVSNDGALKTGTSSFQTVSDTMKSLQIVSYTTSSVTFSYSSNYGVQGVTTYSFTINGSPVSCSDFSVCTVSGFTPSNPGLQLSIIGKSINYGNESPSMTISRQLYPVVSSPTFTMSNTLNSITISYSSTGGIPGSTVYQVLFNGTAQKCTSSPCTVSGLSTLSTYIVQVKATNDITTTSSDVKSVKLWDLMTTPILSSTMFTKSATLIFSAIGGDPSLTRYSINVNGSPYASCQSIVANKCDISQLAPGKSFNFTVSATNAGTTLSKSILSSTFSEISGETLSLVNVTTKSMTVSYGVTGGIPGETKYTLTANGVNVPNCISISTTLCTIKELNQSTSYLIQMVAVNDVKSLSSSKSITTYTTISKPTISVIGKPKSIFVRFSVTHGVTSPQTTYQVLLNDTVHPLCNGITATTCTINDLETLSTYSVQIIATNDGISKESDVQILTLWDLMSEPIITATVLTRSIQLNYEAPGGNPMETSFLVTMNGVVINDKQDSDPTALCTQSKPDATGICNLNNLDPNSTYTFVVVGINGDKRLNSSLEVQTYPELSNLMVNLNFITTSKISLSYQTENGLPESTLYNVTVNGNPVENCTNIQELTCLIEGLKDGSYEFVEITAKNDEAVLVFREEYETYKQITNPEITVSQTSSKYFEINYVSQFGVPSQTTYDVMVNSTVICEKTRDLGCVFDQLVLGSNYHIQVIAYNDDLSKSEEYYHQTFEQPTPVEFYSTLSTQTSISLVWNASQNGIPSSTVYTTSISYNSQDWIKVCIKSKELSCKIINLATETTYVVQVTAYNTFYDPAVNSTTISTLANNIGQDDQSCKNNQTAPICSSNGVCDNGVCHCKSGWSGIYCQIDTGNNNNGNETITPNPDKPQIGIDNGGINYRFELQMVTEVNELFEPVKSLNLSDVHWNLTSSSNSSIQHPVTGETIIRKEWTYSANSSTLKFSDQVVITFVQHQIPENTTLSTSSYPINFAGKEYSINLGSFKFNLRIDHWPFESKLNSIILATEITNPIGVKDECGKYIKPSINDTYVTSNLGVTSFNIGDGRGNYVVANLLNTIIVDHVPMSATHSFVQNKDGYVTINSVIPHFEQSATVDPDFSLILSPKKDDENQGQCHTKVKESNWRIIVGAVIGGAAAVTLASGAAILAKKRASANRDNKKVMASVQKSTDHNVQLDQ